MNFCAGCEECIFTVDNHDKRGYYEIHLTTNTPNLDNLLSIGNQNNIKFISIDIGQNKKSQVMTAQKLKGSIYDVEQEINRMSDLFNEHGIEVIRKKVEAYPDKSLPFVYYEVHIQILIDKKYVEFLRSKISYYSEGWHFSKNKFKNFDNKEVFMLTYRFYINDIEKFNEKIINMYELLKMLQVDILKTIKEQCVYDTNVSLDNEWFKGNI